MAKRWTFTGSRRDDDYEGTDANDRIRGRAGDDDLEGDDGDDLLVGGKGRDRLSGDDGDDVLRGGRGADWLEAGEGFDRLFGGAGRDRFDFSDDDDGVAVVMDFQPGKDVIIFERDDDDDDDDDDDRDGDDGFSGFRDMLGSAREKGDDVVIRTEDGKVRIKDVDIADLEAGDFMFV